eukprot:scaffold23130_cov63-Phaeocystis_antarctica.AAC.2
MLGIVPFYADTYVPGPPYCTYGLRVPASCVVCVPEAQGSLSRTVRTPYTYQPQACRMYCVPWHHRSRSCTRCRSRSSSPSSRRPSLRTAATSSGCATRAARRSAATTPTGSGSSTSSTRY